MTVSSDTSSQRQPRSPDSVAWGKCDEGATFKQAQKTAWAGAFRSQLQEFDYEITEIEGEIPDGLKGSTLFRNGPGRFERGQQRVAHYLDGDGYLAKIAISPREGSANAPTGKAYFSSRFVRTAEHEQEAAAFSFGRRLAMRKQAGHWRVYWSFISRIRRIRMLFPGVANC
jgi:all-trans-8'-apo-beta-carotenal 15,15'-oxygenase